MMSEEKQIILKFKGGDAAAFDIIYHKYSKKLYNFAYGLLKDIDAAGEIVQEVFVNLWEKREQVDTTFNFENYIFTITFNSIRKFFRKRSMENKVKNFLLKNSPEVIENTDGSIIYNELLELANETIEKLPPKRKIVYKLSRHEGIKIKEIASRLNISTRTAENHLAKALKFLKEEMEGISLYALVFYYLFIG